MTVTPQTNATLEEIADKLLQYRTYVICGHVNPDGDCIGSTLGLAAALRAIGKEVTTLQADDSIVDDNFSFMSGFDDLVPASKVDGKFDVFVSVDVPNNERLGESAAHIKQEASHTITIDHHAYHERTSELSYTDPDIASTTMIIWKLVKLLGIDEADPAWKDIATCCYAGLLTDTGRFLHSNTNAEALLLASQMAEAGARLHEASVKLFQNRSFASIKIDSLAIDHLQEVTAPNTKMKALLSWVSRDELESLGANSNDVDNAINVMREIAGYSICCMLKETKRGIRGSLRSKGDVDVAVIAQRFGGGGHKAAAGFTLDCTLAEAVDTMKWALQEEIRVLVASDHSNDGHESR